MNLPRKFDGRVVDHIDRNPLNNQQGNLRIVTLSENAQNRSSNREHSSKYRGVIWYPWTNKWLARVYHNGRSIHLGYIDVVDEAGRVAAEARKRLMPFATD